MFNYKQIKINFVMIRWFLILLIGIVIVGIAATAIRLAIDYFNGDTYGVPFDGALFIVIMSPIIGWFFVADWLLKYYYSIKHT